MDYRKVLLDIYKDFPFEEHPFWQGVLTHSLTFDEIIRGEIQHVIRTREGKELRWYALHVAPDASRIPELHRLLTKTYLEECTEDESGPSHLELIKRLVLQGGASEEDLMVAEPTPGNAAAIALYKDITQRGAACHMLGAGVVEWYYSKLSPKVYDAYVNHYGMSPFHAETYRIHGPMDEKHAERAFEILDAAIAFHDWATIRLAVRDAFVGTCLHYDGMYQAAKGCLTYWNGRR